MVVIVAMTMAYFKHVFFSNSSIYIYITKQKYMRNHHVMSRFDHRYILVGGFNSSEKYEFVSWDDDIPNIWNFIKFHGSKPPTRYSLPNIPLYPFGIFS
jgi:hypothetical protein